MPPFHRSAPAPLMASARPCKWQWCVAWITNFVISCCTVTFLGAGAACSVSCLVGLVEPFGVKVSSRIDTRFLAAESSVCHDSKSLIGWFCGTIVTWVSSWVGREDNPSGWREKKRLSERRGLFVHLEMVCERTLRKKMQRHLWSTESIFVCSSVSSFWIIIDVLAKYIFYVLKISNCVLRIYNYSLNIVSQI